MAASTSTIGELTAEQVSTILTQPLEQQAVFLAAGPTVFDTDGSPVRVPKAPSFDTPPAWHGENEQITETEAQTSELQLLPSTMESLKVITRYSNELARQSIVNLDAALQSRLVADVAGRLDAQFLGAGGDGVTQPQGMFAWTGVQTIGTVGVLSLDAILDAQTLALTANVDPSRMALFLRPDDYMAIRAVKDSTGRYLVVPDAQTGGTIVPLLGARVHVSSRIPEGSAALVDMSQVAVARDLAPSVKVLTERYADFDQQGIRVVARYDSAPLNPEAVVTLTGITPPAA